MRIYAIKLDKDVFVITGGAIKLTRTMQERAHTQRELERLERVRNFLLEEGAVDVDGIKTLSKW